MIIALLSSVFLLASTEATAAEAITREAAVREAIAGSPVLARADAGAEEYSWKKTEVLTGFLPSLQVTASRYFVKQFQYNDISLGGGGPPAHIPLIFPASSAMLTASVPLDGLTNLPRLSAAKKFSEAAREDSHWARFQLEEETRLRFNEALAARKLQVVAEQNVATLKDHLDQVTKTRKGGLATQYDVLRVEVQLNEADSELLRAKDDVVLSKQKLSQTMGIDPTTEERDLAGELEVPIVEGIDTLKIGDAADRTDFHATALRAEASESLSTAASRYWVPRFSLGAHYILYNNLNDNLSDWEKYRAAWDAGIFMTWNIFDGMSSIAKSKEAGWQSVQATKDMERARLQLPTDFEFWKRRYLYSAALYTAKLSEVKKGEESVRLAKAALRAGVRTNSEVLDAELDLFRARAGLVNALKSSAEAHIRLELALGRKLQTLAKR
jgi:outer membrane protein TolC